jgi:hypothetical protein
MVAAGFRDCVTILKDEIAALLAVARNDITIVFYCHCEELQRRSNLKIIHYDTASLAFVPDRGSPTFQALASPL